MERTVPVRFLHAQNALHAMVAIGVDAAETVWSPVMYDTLVDLVGPDDLVEKCQAVFLRHGSKSGFFLPSSRDQLFDLNTLTMLLSKIQRFTCSPADNKTPHHQTDTSNPRAQLVLPPNYQSASAEFDSHVPLSTEELSDRTQHLANTVFAFRQRWAHDVQSISLIEYLDGMLAVQELWPVFVQRELAGAGKEAAGHMPCPSKQLETCIDFLQATCSSNGPLHTSRASIEVLCSWHGLLKVVCVQIVQLISPLLRNTLHAVLPGACQNGKDWPELLKIIPSPGKARRKLPVEHQQRIDTLLSWIAGRMRLKPTEKLMSDVLPRISGHIRNVNCVRSLAFHSAELSLDNVSMIRNGIQAGKELAHMLKDSENVAEGLAELHSILPVLQREGRSFRDQMREQRWIAVEVLIPRRLLDVIGSDPEESSRRQLFIQQPRVKPCFAGRTEELSRLMTCLQPGVLAVLSGPPGSGKTALAVELAFALRSRFTRQVWIPGLSPNTARLALQRYRHVSQAWGGPESVMQKGSTSDLSTTWQEATNQNALYIIDGLQTPHTLLQHVSKEILRHNVVLCTTWDGDNHKWSQEWGQCIFEHLQPLDVEDIITMLQARASQYCKDPNIFAKFIVHENPMSFLENQANQPLDLHSFASRIKRNDIAEVLDNLRSNCIPTTNLAGVEVGSGDASLLHNDGHEALLRRSVPSLTAEEKTLLVSLSLLGRTTSNIPWCFFGCHAAAGQPVSDSAEWKMLLTSNNEFWSMTRESTLQGLCNQGLVHWCPAKRSVNVNILLQRHAARLLPEIDYGYVHEPVTVSAIRHEICRAVCCQFKFTYEADDYQLFSNTPPPYVVKLVCLGESLLKTRNGPMADTEVELYFWLARSVFTLHLEFETAVEYYDKALCLACSCGDTTGSLIATIEMGMTLWRCSYAIEAVVYLEEAEQCLLAVNKKTIADPCIDHKHLVTTLLDIVRWELKAARHNRSGVNAGLVNSREDLVHPSGPCDVRIGPLALSDLTHDADVAMRAALQNLCAGEVHLACDLILCEITRMLDSALISATMMCVIPLLYLLEIMSLCLDYETFSFYTEVVVDLERTIMELGIEHCSRDLCLHRIDKFGKISDAMHQAFFEKMASRFKSAIKLYFEIFSQVNPPMHSFLSGELGVEGLLSSTYKVLITKVIPITYNNFHRQMSLLSWNIHPAMTKYYVETVAARAKDNFIDSWIQINDTPSSREQGIDIHEAHGATTHDLMQPKEKVRQALMKAISSILARQDMKCTDWATSCTVERIKSSVKKPNRMGYVEDNLAYFLLAANANKDTASGLHLAGNVDIAKPETAETDYFLPKSSQLASALVGPHDCVENPEKATAQHSQQLFRKSAYNSSAHACKSDNFLTILTEQVWCTLAIDMNFDIGQSDIYQLAEEMAATDYKSLLDAVLTCLC